MKKFYETPAVEFTGFNAEDVITTSIVDGLSIGTDDVAATKFNNSVAATTNAAAVDFTSYQW